MLKETYYSLFQFHDFILGYTPEYALMLQKHISLLMREHWRQCFSWERRAAVGVNFDMYSNLYKRNTMKKHNISPLKGLSVKIWSEWTYSVRHGLDAEVGWWQERCRFNAGASLWHLSISQSVAKTVISCGNWTSDAHSLMTTASCERSFFASWSSKCWPRSRLFLYSFVDATMTLNLFTCTWGGMEWRCYLETLSLRISTLLAWWEQL